MYKFRNLSTNKYEKLRCTGGIGYNSVFVFHSQVTLILKENYPNVVAKVYRVDSRTVATQNTGRRRLLQTRSDRKGQNFK